MFLVCRFPSVDGTAIYHFTSPCWRNRESSFNSWHTPIIYIYIDIHIEIYLLALEKLPWRDEDMRAMYL